MNQIKIILIVVGLALAGSTFYLYRENNKNKSYIKDLTTSINTKDTEIGQLTFRSSDFQKYVSGLNTAHKIEIDSILKSQHIKPKSVVKFETINTKINDVDTVQAVSKEVKHINDSVCQINFSDVRKCTKIEGYLLSKDRNTKTFITGVTAESTTYVIDHKKRTFWDVILFRKGKIIKTKTTSCGESTFEEINVE